MKQLAIPIVLALILIAIGAVLQGRYTERWRKMDSEKLQTFTSCVTNVPRVIGDWTGKDDDPISDEEWAATNCTAYVSRTYQNKKTGDMVSFYLVSGTARHITIHTPDWCYAGAGFEQEGEIDNHKMVDVKGVPSTPEFATAVFKKPSSMSGVETALRIFWTYSDDGNWRGPTVANWAKTVYAGRPALYKIYLIGPATKTPGESPCNAFAQAAFPTLQEILFSDAPPDSSDTTTAPSSADLEL